MARYIDSEQVVRELLSLSVTDGLYGRGLSRGIELALSIVNRQDTTDVVEVVRCEECKHLTMHNSPTLYAYCEKNHYRFEPFQTDTRTHFCSYGERKNEDSN